jgi:uncharacterized membrane protein YpjA
MKTILFFVQNVSILILIKATNLNVSRFMEAVAIVGMMKSGIRKVFVSNIKAMI